MIKRLIRLHPVRSYFLITFFISWLGAFIFVAPELFSHKPIAKSDGFMLFPILLLGPIITGLLLTYVTAGKPAMKDLSARMLEWKIPVKWYVLALLLCPLLICIILFFLSHFISSEYTPNFFVLGIAFGLPAGFIEEIGWTGFAFPQMLKKNKPLNASLLLGLLWGIWHLPVIDFLGAASPHGKYLIPFMIAFILALMAVRMIICWIYLNTGSILIAQLFHIVSTGSLVFLGPSKVSSMQETAWYFLYAALLWIVVFIIYLKKGFATKETIDLAKQKSKKNHPAENVSNVYCKNCNHPVAENFCSYCGQSVNTHRINLHFVWHDIQHGFFHFDKGFLFTIKELFTRPGHSIHEYIEGKRVKHASPISLVIILATVCALLYLANNVDNVSITANTNQKINTFTEVGQWIYSHYSLTLLFALPVASLCSYIIFRKAKYNYTEHFVLNAFITSQKLVIRLITFPFFITSAYFVQCREK